MENKNERILRFINFLVNSFPEMKISEEKICKETFDDDDSDLTETHFFYEIDYMSISGIFYEDPTKEIFLGYSPDFYFVFDTKKHIANPIRESGNLSVDYRYRYNFPIPMYDGGNEKEVMLEEGMIRRTLLELLEYNLDY